MSSSVPIQIRTIDPFSSYNSDVVNKFTRMLTFNNNVIEKVQSCDVSLIDSTSMDSTSMVVVSPGVIYKDDVWIEITTQHIVDFTDSLHYVDFNTGFDEAGYYYVVLNYTYQRQRPAPTSEVLILKPSQINLYSPNGEYVFLKAVHVTWTGSDFIIDSVHDYDPTTPTNKREYLRKYIGGVPTLPVFDTTRDLSRSIYVKDEDRFYLGYSDGWRSITSSSIFNIDTSGFSIGDIVYINASGDLSLAISTAAISTADGIVIGTDKVLITGSVEIATVQTGIIVAVGDLLYLSETQAGSLTNVEPSSMSQFVGRCTGINSSTSVSILFVRGKPTSASTKFISSTLPASNWTYNGAASAYYQDINIPYIIDKNAIINIWDINTDMKIEVYDLEFISSTIVRVWMPVNTKNLKFVAIVGSTIVVMPIEPMPE